MNIQIDWTTEIQGMIRHWLSTPENGRLGSGYGYKNTIANLMQEPCCDSATQQIIAKMRQDIPILAEKRIVLSWTAEVDQLIIKVDGDLANFEIKRQ